MVETVLNDDIITFPLDVTFVVWTIEKAPLTTVLVLSDDDVRAGVFGTPLQFPPYVIADDVTLLTQ